MYYLCTFFRVSGYIQNMGMCPLLMWNDSRGFPQAIPGPKEWYDPLVRSCFQREVDADATQFSLKLMVSKASMPPKSGADFQVKHVKLQGFFLIHCRWAPQLRGFPSVPRRCRRTHGVGTVAGTVARAEWLKRKTQWGHPAVGWKFPGFKGFDGFGVLKAIFLCKKTRDVWKTYDKR